VSARRGIQPAVRRGKKARIALDGPAGSGKTWTALMTARELVGEEGRILVIDTERGSASLYSDEFSFDELVWEPPYDPRELAETLAAESGKYAVIVVDSLSHFWRGEGGTLDIVDASARRDAGGNRMGGWKTGTPAQNTMVDALLLARCHVIVTMRAATEWVMEKDEKGKTKPRKIGLAPVQRNDLDFEFTVVADLDLEHAITVSKSRCHPLADRVFPAGHGPKLGQILRGWLESASPEQPKAEPANGAAPAEASRTPQAETKAPISGNVVDRVAAAIDALGDKRGLFLGQHRITVKGGKPDLSGLDRMALSTLAAELAVTPDDEIRKITGETVPAGPAVAPDEDIPF
jgi:DNA polymerase III delta prime subunit